MSYNNSAPIGTFPRGNIGSVDTNSTPIRGVNLANDVSVSGLKPNVESVMGPSAVSGGRPFTSYSTSEPLDSRLRASSVGALEAALNAQKPGDPIGSAVPDEGDEVANGSGVIIRQPSKNSLNPEVYHKRMPLFIMREKRNAKAWSKKGIMPYSKSQLMNQRHKAFTGEHKLFSLPRLNKTLYEMQKKRIFTPEEIATGALDFAHLSFTPQDVYATIAFDGFCTGQLHGAGHMGPNIGRTDRSAGMATSQVVEGAAYTVYNVWGDKIVRDGQELYFLIMGVPVEKQQFSRKLASSRNRRNKEEETEEGPRYRTNPSIPYKTPANAPEKRGFGRLDTPIMVIPWTSDKYDVPQSQHLEYTDDYGRLQYGERIYVGFVRKMGPSDEKNAAISSPYDAASMLDCPRIDIIVNPYKKPFIEYF